MSAHSIVALQIAQTFTEEEVIRQAHVGGVVRIRRYLLRFMVVIVIALAVEALVATFKVLHEDTEQLPHAASQVFAVGVILLAGWGLFLWLARGIEEEGKVAGEPVHGGGREAE